MYPQTSSYALPQTTPTPTPGPTTGKFSAKPASVITNAQSFTLSLGAHASPQSSAAAQQPVTYPTYPPQVQTQYPTMPYYYPQPYTGTQYAPPPTEPSTSAAPASSNQQSTSAAGNAGSQGAWADDELERLKQLAEQSKTAGGAGSYEWDWVVNQWGPSRTRYAMVQLT